MTDQDREKSIEAVKSGVSCKRFLTPSKGGNFCCPFCGSGTHRGNKSDGALKVFADNGWTCFACPPPAGKDHNSGDVLDLIQQVKGVGFDDALQIGLEYLGKPGNMVQKAVHKQPKQSEPAEDYTQYYNTCRSRLMDPESSKYPDAIEYLAVKRGISEKTAERFKIGYDPEADPLNAPGGIGKVKCPCRRIIIPVNSSYYIGRRIDDVNDKRVVNNAGGKTGIFNEEALQKSDVIFVVEGAFDAMSIEEVGQSAVATNSTSNTNKLIESVKASGTSAMFVISFDNDENAETAKRTRDEEKKLSDELSKLGVKNIIANVSGKHKDANEALVNDYETFRETVESIAKKARETALQISNAPAPAKEESASAAPVIIETGSGTLTVNQASEMKPAEKKPAEEIPSLVTYNADYFNNTEIKTPTPIIERILFPGLGMLGSPAKMGKSFMMLQLAVSVATGTPFMGFKIIRPGAVLYCDLQGTQGRTKKRLEFMGFNEMPNGVEVAYQARTTDTGFLEQLERWIQAKDNPVLIIVDMLQQVKGNQRRTENAYQADNRIIAPLHDLAIKYNICIFAVMHTRKGNSKFIPDDPFNEINGSGGQFGTADSGWMILGKREESNKRFSVICRDSDEGQEDFEATFKDHKWSISGTVEEMKEERANEEYNSSPVTFTLRKLVEESGGAWYGTMQDLMNEVAEKTAQYPAATPQKMKAMLDSIEYRLSCEGIMCKRPNPNGGRGGRRYKFYRDQPKQISIEE